MPENKPIDYEQVFNSILTFQVVLDREFKIIGATDAYIGISLASREEIMGKSVLEAFPQDLSNTHSDGMQKFAESLQQVLVSKQTQNMGIIRYDIPSGNGDGKFVERWWRLRNNPVLDSKGEVVWIVTNVDDINEMMDVLESAEKALVLKKSTGQDAR
jgi:PAS domain S-box-containing protein